MTFEIGDIVKLKGAGVNMTVVGNEIDQRGANPSRLKCQWYAHDLTLQTDWFLYESVEKVDKEVTK